MKHYVAQARASGPRRRRTAKVAKFTADAPPSRCRTTPPAGAFFVRRRLPPPPAPCRLPRQVRRRGASSWRRRRRAHAPAAAAMMLSSVRRPRMQPEPQVSTAGKSACPSGQDASGGTAPKPSAQAPRVTREAHESRGPRASQGEASGRVNSEAALAAVARASGARASGQPKQDAAEGDAPPTAPT